MLPKDGRRPGTRTPNQRIKRPTRIVFLRFLVSACLCISAMKIVFLYAQAFGCVLVQPRLIPPQTPTGKGHADYGQERCCRRQSRRGNRQAPMARRAGRPARRRPVGGACLAERRLPCLLAWAATWQ